MVAKIVFQRVETADDPSATNPPDLTTFGVRSLVTKLYVMATCFLSEPLVLYGYGGDFFYIILLEPFGFVSCEQKFDNLLTIAASEACWKEMCVRVGMGI